MSIKVAHIIEAFKEIPFNKMLGLELDNANPQQLILRFNMKNELIGNFYQGILHGGVISSVLDMAGGMAVMLSALEKHPHASQAELLNIIGHCSTVDLQISYINPGRGKFFTATASLIKSGNFISFTRSELFNDTEQLIAHAHASYLLKSL